MSPVSQCLRGSCLCGEVEFEITGAPIELVHCHCTRCRRASSSAYTSTLLVERADFRWLRGETRVARFRLPEAEHFRTAFCRRCGSDLPRMSRDMPVVIVPAGSLDGDPGIRPSAHNHVDSKAKWFEITDGVPQFAQRPPLL